MFFRWLMSYFENCCFKRVDILHNDNLTFSAIVSIKNLFGDKKSHYHSQNLKFIKFYAFKAAKFSFHWWKKCVVNMKYRVIVSKQKFEVKVACWFNFSKVFLLFYFRLKPSKILHLFWTNLIKMKINLIAHILMWTTWRRDKILMRMSMSGFEL